MSFYIEEVKARQIIDSRGNPTVEADIILSNGVKGTASVPSGASTGVHEALELRDNEKSMYMGRGVLQAVDNINSIIAPELIEFDVLNQREIDNLLINLDGTENKSRLGANAMLAVSLACARAASLALNIPLFQYIGGINAVTLPTPMMNIIKLPAFILHFLWIISKNGERSWCMFLIIWPAPVIKLKIWEFFTEQRERFKAILLYFNPIN